MVSGVERVRRGDAARSVQRSGGLGYVSEGSWVVRRMHVHGIWGMHTPERTLLGRPQRAVERLTTAAAGALARLIIPAVHPLRLVAMGASVGPPVRLGVGGQGVHDYLLAALTSALRQRWGSLYACWDAVSGQRRARDGVDLSPVQRGGCLSELVGVSKRYEACACMVHEHTHCKSAPRSRRLREPRRGCRQWQQVQKHPDPSLPL